MLMGKDISNLEPQIQMVPTQIHFMDQLSYQVFFPEFFFEKATIEVLGGTEIEPGTQTHQITKLIDFHTKMKP